MITTEVLRNQLNAVQTHENMSTEELEQASSEMNKIICTALNEIEHTAGNSDIIRRWLEAYLEIWNNKSGLKHYGANLRNANLSYARLLDVDLSRANLLNANLSHAKLLDANLSDANLRNANLSYARFSCANLSGASLSAANLSFTNLFNTNLIRADLSDADMGSSILRNAKLSHANLSYANLSAANLSAANLIHANLGGANLGGADLSAANLRCANLFNADLSGADLSFAQLLDADFSHANLRRVYLRVANLRNVNLSDAVVIGTDFTIVRNGNAVMTKPELEAKLADAIKTPDELLRVIQYFLDDSVQSSLSKKDLDMLPSLYEAAVDIGNNGAKNRKDESVICQPDDEICQELRKSVRLLNKRFPVLTITSMDQLQTKAKSILNPSVVITIAKFLKGFSPRDNGEVVIAKDVAAKIVSERLSNTTDKATEPDGLSKKIANNLVGMVWGGSLSMKQVIAPGNLLSEREKSLKPVEQILSEAADYQTPRLTTTTLVSANAPPIPAPVKLGAPVRHGLSGQQRDF